MRMITMAAASALLFGSGALAQMTTLTVTDPSNPANVANTPTSGVTNQPEQGTPIQRQGPASATDTLSGANAGTIAPTTGTTTTATMPGSSETGSTTTATGAAVAPADGSAATGHMTTPANPNGTMGTAPPPQTMKRSGKPKPQDR